MREVVGKYHIRNLVVLDISHNIAVKIAEVNDMHLLERIEKITRDGIAETVLEDDDVATVIDTRAHLRDLGVATHEGIIGTSGIGLEELPFGRSILTGYLLFRNLELDIGGGVFTVFWSIIVEILCCFFHLRLAGERGHRAYEIGYQVFLIV